MLPSAGPLRADPCDHHEADPDDRGQTGARPGPPLALVLVLGMIAKPEGTGSEP